jgi:hypothetical protein
MVKFIAAACGMFVCLVGEPCGASSNFFDSLSNTIPQSLSCSLANSNFSLGVKKFLNSFTSYQFPNPFQPSQDPLSRLEFPIDQWFVGLTTKYDSRLWSLNGSAWMNFTRESSRKFQDSDWDDENVPDQKTIYSESSCRLNRGVLCDVGMSAAVPYVRSGPLRPVFGYRYQDFLFTTHDGAQVVLGGSTMDLPGDGIQFRQIFNHVYLGLGLNRGVNLGSFSGFLPSVCLDLQADYAWITARNEDLHLLRPGNRKTVDTTSGHCWHLFGAANIFRSNSLTARIEVDFKRLITYGSHQLHNDLFTMSFTFDGSKVWSDQASISAVGAWYF